MIDQEEKPTLEQDGIARNDKGQVVPGAVLNPNANGGFQENPQNINYGGRPKNQESFTYWMNFFKNMTVDEFKLWEKTNPESTQTVAASLAYARVFAARSDLSEFKEVADRTEGRAPQTIIHEGGFFAQNKLEIVEVANDTEIEPEAEAGTDSTE